MVWISGRYSQLTNALGISLNAVLIIGSGVMAWRYAMARDFVSHRRWALRTFMLASGGWFMRLGYMAWIILNQGPVGIGGNGDGPFDIVWQFGSFLLPLLMLGIYLRVKQSGTTSARLLTTAALVVSSVLTAVGIFGAYLFMWRPLL